MSVDELKTTFREIMAACLGDPAKTELAISNLEQLIRVMQKYDIAPRYYNASLAGQDQAFMGGSLQMYHPQQDRGRSLADNALDIPTELEKIYCRKLNLSHLQKLATELSARTLIRLDRDTKRNRTMLIKWFKSNWGLLHPRIYEYNLQNMQFT